jgi:ribosome modulation factor
MERQFERLISEEDDKLRDAWNDGIRAVLANSEVSEKDCPYGETALWTAWVGGMYKCKYRLLKGEKSG